MNSSSPPQKRVSKIALCTFFCLFLLLPVTAIKAKLPILFLIELRGGAKFPIGGDFVLDFQFRQTARERFI